MKNKKGKVWLVGGGPGDPGLMTVKGKQILEQAEVVVYDALIGPGVLASIPPSARRIYVGKRAGRHTAPQQEINQILFQEALSGKQVVRLKGGDPFVFGRGGEELELLARNGIPFEVIPGVTSAVAVPAYAGIPATHRDCSSSLHIITAHPKAGKEPDLDYRALARLGGTLVFLMGVSAAEEICDNLTAAGLPPEIPAAIIENGTTSLQRKLVSNLANLARQAKEQNFLSPSVIVVGEVCGLSARLSWLEQLPLHGLRVLNTRPRERSASLTKKLSELGAEVIEYPAIKTQRLDKTPALQKELHSLDQYQWAAFTSPAGVAYFWDILLEEGMDCRSLHHLRFAAIGSATADALLERGIRADYVPPIYSAGELGKGLSKKLAAGEKVLLPRAKQGSQELLMELQRGQASYTDLPIYETVPDLSHCPELTKLVQERRFDLAAFTSGSAVRGFLQAAQGVDCSGLNAVCIGEPTALEARKYGMETIVSKEASVNSMVERIAAFWQERQKGKSEWN